MVLRIGGNGIQFMTTGLKGMEVLFEKSGNGNSFL